MKYHLQILKKYISINTSAEDIAQNLILKTCEIEDIYTRKIAKSIVIGQIQRIEKHPDADKLNVCQVNCGEHWSFQIICWGTNVAEGIFVPVALVGTFFPASGITIAKRAMRGVDSEWMICSKTELDIPEDQEHHWIWNLGEDLEVGQDDLGLALSEKFPWLDATVFEVDNKSLTNRPDLTGHFGAAIELNALYPDTLKRYNKTLEYMQTFKTTDMLALLEQSDKKITKQIQLRSDAVLSYIAVQLQGIDVKKSDFFTRLQLLDLGAKPVNNWVDFSNLFMQISGQPIHCFDADKIKGDIIIRYAQDGEAFLDLFGVEHHLIGSDLVIADEEKILALAGVIGGLSSGITEHTKNILVEIANFDPVVVRKTGTRLGLRTDAELRFEKNINPVFSLYALLLFLDELKFYAKDLGSYEIWGLGYALASGLNPHHHKLIEVDRNALENLIFGTSQSEFTTKAMTILKALGFEVMQNQLSVPVWRSPDDINISEDIAEEIARVWGYDEIAEQPLLAQLKDQPFSPEVKIARIVEELLVEQLKFDQIETYPWTSESLVQQLWGSSQALYHLQNPLNPEFPVLRDRMLYNFIPLAQRNSKFFEGFRIYDIWKTWNKNKPLDAQGIDSRYAEEAINEELTLGACMYLKQLSERKDDPILEMKSVLKLILEVLGVKWKISFEKSDASYFHPKKQAKIFLRNGALPLEIGYLASLHPLILKHHKFPETAQFVVFELNLDVLKTLMAQQSYEKDYETLQDQILWRDLSFTLQKEQDFGPLVETLEKMPNIIEVQVFDLYQGENLGEDKKSISLQLKIKGDGSMTTEQISQILQDAIKRAEKTWAQLRV